MTQEQKDFLRTMGKRSDEIMEQAMATGCDLCHLPYVTEQDELDEICDQCALGKLLQSLKKEAHESGCVVGLLSASIMAANAAEAIIGYTAEDEQTGKGLPENETNQEEGKA